MLWGKLLNRGNVVPLTTSGFYLSQTYVCLSCGWCQDQVTTGLCSQCRKGQIISLAKRVTSQDLLIHRLRVANKGLHAWFRKERKTIPVTEERHLRLVTDQKKEEYAT